MMEPEILFLPAFIHSRSAPSRIPVTEEHHTVRIIARVRSILPNAFPARQCTPFGSPAFCKEEKKNRKRLDKIGRIGIRDGLQTSARACAAWNPAVLSLGCPTRRWWRCRMRSGGMQFHVWISRELMLTALSKIFKSQGDRCCICATANGPSCNPPVHRQTNFPSCRSV